MKKAGMVIIVGLCAAFSSLAAYYLVGDRQAPAVTPSNHFPIVSRFELPRNYGYFIGDEIPLTLVIETAKGVVLDLVNLPKKGEKHGLLEIRDVSITSTSVSPDHKEYRAAYSLQYFGGTPLTVQFEGLEILYALPDDLRGPERIYAYKSLFTQPVSINLSRIGPFRPTRAMEVKGPLEDRRSGLMWISYIAGALLLLVALSKGVREWQHRRKQIRPLVCDAPSPADMTLQTLRQEGAVLRPVEEPAFPVVARLNHLIREYFVAGFAIPAFALTTRELAAHLNDKPFCQDLLCILDRCDILKYQPAAETQEEERQLWWEAMMVFEKLHKVDSS
jgi:hypothetical protein